MRALAGAIVVLAGAVLAGAGAVARALPRINNYIAGSEAGYAGVTGAVLILVGLAILAVGLITPDHRTPGAAADPKAAERSSAA